MSDENSGLLAKLRELDERYAQIEKEMSDPEVASNVEKVVSLSKEQGKLRPMVEKYREYAEAVQGVEESEVMLNDPDVDPEFAELAKAEIEELSAKRDTLIEEIKETLVMADDASIGSIIMEIRAGTGGDEAALFARDLAAMYTRYAEKNGWKVETMEMSANELGGFREVILNIKGDGVWVDFGYESGGHRVQRVPETETQGRIHTSAATVAVLPEPEEVEVDIDPNDVVEHVSRAGGPGGQSVNKTNSAIKLEHVPSGITVSMRDEKSQHKNRSKAWRILRSRLYEHQMQELNQERDQQRKTMIGSGDRSQRIRTYNFPQNRLTDHRINLSLYSLDKVIMGELDEVVAALKEHDKQERLKNL
ncbi:Peptide chain release factor 1 [Anaerohalosphaera lusitana]|uniref:Peptide chain release factor 1 n=1 Tax=Anaerohalosphaera lusitana TaxID=1936003 RepID=A0A1U9NII9_9BACT|nr:peptide chain release factor 1 [Anaerohalosphaera lusitana]AQT67752.1 Peptide chain release factor 1 [Anaerohalosphaera lusitana]